MSGIAYLFERFPSFTQTFCFREASEMLRRRAATTVYSIRSPVGEPHQDFPEAAANHTIYLPSDFSATLQSDASFRRAARKWTARLAKEWGDESEKRRIYEALWLAPRLRASEIRHVHVHFAGIAARTAYWLKKVSGIPFSFTAHANDVFCDEPLERLEQLVREASTVVTVSDFSVGYLRQKFPDRTDKFHRVYNGIDLDEFPLGTTKDDPPCIVAVGRYIEKKGFADLISACAKLGPRKFQCRIIGEGPLAANLAARVVELGLAERVSVEGPRSAREIAALLGNASIFALPCIDLPGGAKDNLPTVIMEAMAAGLPVVSTPVAGIPEMVVDSQSGFLVPERSPDTLAVRLAELLDHPEKCRAFGQTARELCAARFAIEKTVDALLAAIGQPLMPASRRANC